METMFMCREYLNRRSHVHSAEWVSELMADQPGNNWLNHPQRQRAYITNNTSQVSILLSNLVIAIYQARHELIKEAQWLCIYIYGQSSLYYHKPTGECRLSWFMIIMTLITIYRFTSTHLFILSLWVISTHGPPSCGILSWDSHLSHLNKDCKEYRLERSFLSRIFLARLSETVR